MRLAIIVLLQLMPFTQFSYAVTGSEVRGKNLLDGKEVQVSANNKNGLVVVFLSSKCPCSNSHIAELSSLASSFPDFKFVAVHSNSNEDESSSKIYFESKKLPFPVIQDSKAELADRFKALKTPHAFVLDAKGETVYQGGISNSADFARSNKNYLRDALEDIHAGRNVKVSNGRTLGCVIQRG